MPEQAGQRFNLHPKSPPSQLKSEHGSENALAAEHGCLSLPKSVYNRFDSDASKWRLSC